MESRRDLRTEPEVQRCEYWVKASTTKSCSVGLSGALQRKLRSRGQQGMRHWVICPTSRHCMERSRGQGIAGNILECAAEEDPLLTPLS